MVCVMADTREGAATSVRLNFGSFPGFSPIIHPRLPLHLACRLEHSSRPTSLETTIPIRTTIADVVKLQCSPNEFHPALVLAAARIVLHAILPITLLATPNLSPEPIIPLPCKRYLALHHLLDLDLFRCYSSDCRALGLYRAMAELEDYLGGSDCVCDYWGD